MKIDFIGHAAFRITSGHFVALIDPFISGNPLTDKTVDDYLDTTHIFITHGHGDHLGDAVALAKKTHALVICNFEIGQFLGRYNLRVHPMHIGGRYRFDFGLVKMTPAIHGSSISLGEDVYDGGMPGGFLIEIGGFKVYHAGDTGLTMEMHLLRDEKIHLALLPIGGNFTMDIADAKKAVEMIQPLMVVPMHYDTFPIIKTDVSLFEAAIEDARVIVMKPGDSFLLES